MLPSDPVVLLVHADGVGDDPRLALFVGHRDVDVVDLAQAVAAEREGLGHPPEAPLTGVEGVLPTMDLARVSIGHDHLADRGTVKDRPRPATVVIAHLVEHEPLVGIPPQPQRPFLPAHQVAFHGEAGTVGLGDRDRSEIGTQRPDVPGSVAGTRRRNRHGFGAGAQGMIDDLDDLTPTQVDVHDHPLDRPGIAVVVVGLPHEGDASGDPSALLGRVAEPTGGPGIDLHPCHVGDAPPSQRGEVVGVLDTGDDGAERLPEQESWAHPLDDATLKDLPMRDRNDELDHRQLGAGHDQGANGPADRVTRLPGGQRLLRRLLQHDMGDDGPFAQLAGRRHHGASGRHLLGAEQAQRMVDPHGAAPGPAGRSSPRASRRSRV